MGWESIHRTSFVGLSIKVRLCCPFLQSILQHYWCYDIWVLVITFYCVVPCPEANIPTIRGKPLPHSSLSSFLTFVFFLCWFSFYFFFRHSLCFFPHSLASFLLYVWLLFVCLAVCLSLSYFSFITQKCNSVESYKIWNFSETNLETFTEREVDRLS